MCDIWWCPAPVAQQSKWCIAHEVAYQRTGNPLAIPTKTIEERFFEKVRFTNSCWFWEGARQWKGHGSFYYAGDRIPAHRWAYEYLVGPIPPGLYLDHLCMNPPCVNPAHLEPVTNAENLRRAVAAYQKESCPHGHAYDEKNTYHSKNGRRHCRECARLRSLERGRKIFGRTHLFSKPATSNAEKTHCPYGHAYDHVLPNGKRSCRTCNREAMRRYRAKKAAGS